MTPNEAAQKVGTSRWTIMRAINAQHLRATRDNRNQWRIASDDLAAWQGAHPAHSAHTVQDAEPAQDAKPAAHPAQESAHPDNGLRDELETLRKAHDDLKRDLVAVSVRLEEAVKRAERAESNGDEWRKQAQALANHPALTVPERPQDGPVEVETPAPAPERPQEPDKSQEAVESLQKRLEWAEARMLAAVRALEHVQDRSVEIARAETPARGRPGLLARLMGRG